MRCLMVAKMIFLCLMCALTQDAHIRHIDIIFALIKHIWPQYRPIRISKAKKSKNRSKLSKFFLKKKNENKKRSESDLNSVQKTLKIIDRGPHSKFLTSW